MNSDTSRSSVRLIVVCVLLAVMLGAEVAAAQPAPVAAASAAPAQPPLPTQAQVDELRATVASLQDRLLTTEKELGQEKARRAALEQEKFRDSLKALDPSVQRLLGMSPPEPPKPSAEAAPPKKN